ncbi:hypothetical protein ACFVKC_21555 [Streptomyces noursei]
MAPALDEQRGVDLLRCRVVLVQREEAVAVAVVVFAVEVEQFGV